ncbi:MAG: GHKL domain-containing protein [Pseudonocardiaceae bacterium]|nr:GHKL domain-containing protein [Pseudonocardiaceae bacterium]
MGVSPRARKQWSLAQQLLVLQVAIVGTLVGGGVLLAYLDANRATEDRAREEVVSVAATVADAPNVRSAFRSADPTGRLQPFAERVRADTGVDFITIMTPNGIRYTHPDPERIGHRFIGNTRQALAGRVFTETYTGTLGPSMRAVVPVFDADRRITGLVSVGITVRAISAELRERLVPLFTVAAGVLVVGVTGSYLVSLRLRRHTRGRAPGELASMFSYYEAILHAVREGLVLVGRDGRVELCNDGARELLGLSGNVQGRPVSELALPADLAAAMTGTKPRTDEIHVTDTSVIVLNTAPVASRGGAMGNVVTLRDHTELQALTGELNTVKGFTESLRSQAHEAANRLHTVVSLVELGRSEEAVRFATAELALAQRLTDQVVHAVSEPVLAALLLGKTAEAHERGIELVITEDTEVDELPDGGVEPRDLVTILGNLIDNAMAAAAEAPGERRVFVTARIEGAELVLRVADTGSGMDPDAVRAAFRRGWSTKRDAGRGLGLALVGQVVRKHGGSIDVDSRTVFTVRLPLRAEATP